MKILIIEDEAQTAWDLKQTIHRLYPQHNILATLGSNAEVEEWFAHQQQPDLIFSDIQLGDGLVFEVFEKYPAECPVIFCTAYDEYLLQAFKTNGIDYLLKPINEQEVEKSFTKLQLLQRGSMEKKPEELRKAISQLLQQPSGYKSNFLIPYRDKMIPVSIDDIACFSVKESGSEVLTMDGKTYPHSFTLDYLASVLDPQVFYRANRQYIVAHHAIKEIETHTERKLILHLKPANNELIVVSKAKATPFLSWVEKV